jgi:hypothetical protein
MLAGTVMAALWKAMGRETQGDAALNHAVLHLEQMLTTGGGWQDQVGSLELFLSHTHTLSPHTLSHKLSLSRTLFLFFFFFFSLSVTSRWEGLWAG